MSFLESRQFYKPSRTASGIIYYIRVNPGTYSESYIREGSQITAEVVTTWNGADQFVKELVGYTTYSGGTPDRFQRSLPLAVPYRPDLYASSVTLTAYGTYDDDNSFAPLAYPAGHEMTGSTATGKPPFYVDPYGAGAEKFWPKWTHVCYRVVFTHKIYRNLKRDDQLSNTTAAGDCPEFDRYVLKRDELNVRELRRPDVGFQTVEAKPQTIPIVGFVPSIEKELFYTWFEVPYEKAPRTYYESTDILLHVNDAAWDNYAAGTMLYVGAKDYEVPYRGPDGSLYVDPTLHFRFNPIGWNKILRRGGTIVDVVTKAADGVVGGLPPYATTDQFYRLFRPS